MYVNLIWNSLYTRDANKYLLIPRSTVRRYVFFSSAGSSAVIINGNHTLTNNLLVHTYITYTLANNHTYIILILLWNGQTTNVYTYTLLSDCYLPDDIGKTVADYIVAVLSVKNIQRWVLLSLETILNWTTFLTYKD